jgi:putative addiction module killer protein
VVYKIKYTDKFLKIHLKLSIEKQRAVDRRIVRMIITSCLGDYKRIDKDLYELRIFTHGGIRVYFTIQNDEIILLLTIGGKKSKEQQGKDIEIAKKELKSINN